MAATRLRLEESPELERIVSKCLENDRELRYQHASEIRTDLQRLKALITQMRTNLAFVQTSQTPLKHQFELEADAWQVIVEQMDRRLKQMEERRSHDSAH